MAYYCSTYNTVMYCGKAEADKSVTLHVLAIQKPRNLFAAIAACITVVDFIQYVLNE